MDEAAAVWVSWRATRDRRLSPSPSGGGGRALVAYRTPSASRGVWPTSTPTQRVCSVASRTPEREVERDWHTL